MHTLIYVTTAAFSGLMFGLLLRADPAPTPPPADPERDPDYCITHKQLEPKDKR